MDMNGDLLLHIYASYSLLKKQEKQFKDITDSAALKHNIMSLNFSLHFLEFFHGFSTNEDLKMRIERVVFDVRKKLRSLSNKPIDGNLIQDLDGAYSDLREKMKNVIVNPETKEFDVIFLKQDGRWVLDLRETNSFLLKRLEDISRYEIDQTPHLMKETEGIKETIMLLKALLTYLASGKYFDSRNKDHSAPLLGLLDKAACLVYSCSVDKMEEAMTFAMKQKFSHLLEEIYKLVLRYPEQYGSSKDDPLESEFYLLNNLVKLLDSHARYLNDQSKELPAKLKFLRSSLVDLPHDIRMEKFNYLLRSIEAITAKVMPILCSYQHEEMARDVNNTLSEVLNQIKEINLYNYPKTDELGFLDLFLGHLDELLEFHPEKIGILKNQIGTLHLEFDFLGSFLRKIKNKLKEHEELEDLWMRTIGLAYQAEYVIDFYLVKSSACDRVMLSISNIMEKIKLLKSEVAKIYDEDIYDTKDNNVTKASNLVPSQAADTITDAIVGFEDEEAKIMEYLLGDKKKLDVVSVVGMPGLGKTTLAKKLYHCPSIVEYFDVRAWCTISQTYQRKGMLLDILADVGVTNNMNNLNDEELAAKLHKSLKGHKYLIVLDDIWDIGAWNDLRRSFPDDNTCSRILITSRLQIIDSQTKPGSQVHKLRMFSNDESWELLQKNLFLNESFSEDLRKVGQRIAQKCHGLPLAIVVIAGVLAKLEKNIDMWKHIEESLSSHILSDLESQCMAILELSYNHLSDHLKPCFLYMGAFPEDKEIPVRRLTWLWIAEGFVRDTKEKKLEDVAEDYFMDLLSRSLVIATKERSLGGVKACRVHDLLHDFCLKKAKEEKFLEVINVDVRTKFSRVYDQRRLILSGFAAFDDFGKAKPFGCTVRSLLNNSRSYTSKKHITTISQNFKLLKVLDAAYLNNNEFFSGIEKLIHLRYLAMKTNISSISSSISNLWNLQSFLVEATKSYGDEVVHVPDSLWDMVNLRHVHINDRAFFNVHQKRLENSSLLDHLETLSTPCLSYGEESENLLRRLPKLRKLRCIFRGHWDDSTKSCKLPAMEFLDQLISLKVSPMGISHQGKKCEFSFPSCLQKLTLMGFLLLWDDTSKIGKTVPNLKVLKLIGADWDSQWVVDDGDFPNLKYLELRSCSHIIKWIASEDSFPVLEQLVLHNCMAIREIPPCFGDIPTLRMITVKDCHPLVDDSARRIQNQQEEEWGNEVKVYISASKYWRKRLLEVEGGDCW